MKFSARFSPEIVTKMRELKQSGLTYAQVSAELGLGARATARALHEEGSRVGRCERCKRYCKRLHYHHVDYVANIIKKVCPRCHPKEHSASRRKTAERRWNHVIEELRAACAQESANQIATSLVTGP